MKPDWKDAPECAQYLAQDENGAWYWYTEKPAIDYDVRKWLIPKNGKMENIKADNWRETLEKRP